MSCVLISDTCGYPVGFDIFRDCEERSLQRSNPIQGEEDGFVRLRPPRNDGTAVKYLMPYLIDGHNLIPKLGLRLDSVDDEMELVAILQEFARLERRQVEVFFDGAPSPHAGNRSLGTVKAHFVPLGQTADNAILVRLKRLGHAARNWTVVSSDRQVQANARAARAEVISSEEFVGMLGRSGETSRPAKDRKLSPQELDEWLSIFNQHRQKPGE